MSDKKVEKPDEAYIFAEVDVSADGKNYKVKPWTLGKLVKVSPLLDKIMKNLTERKATLDFTKFNIAAMTDLYFSSIEQIVDIIHYSVDIPKEEVEALTLNGTFSLVSAIISINLDAFKSFFNLFSTPEPPSEGPGEEGKGQA